MALGDDRSIRAMVPLERSAISTSSFTVDDLVVLDIYIF
jgi:hypothetical protein